MSVAFRRESDEEHLEPKFELPIPAGPNLVTPRGLALIVAQREALEADLKGATASGADEDALKRIKRDLRYWHTRQATAEIAPPPHGDAVEFGTRVRFLLNGAEKTVRLVGDDEADPATGLISFKAPLARAMMGSEEGELLPFGGKADAIEILQIDAGEG